MVHSFSQQVENFRGAAVYQELVIATTTVQDVCSLAPHTIPWTAEWQ